MADVNAGCVKFAERKKTPLTGELSQVPKGSKFGNLKFEIPDRFIEYTANSSNLIL